MLNEQYLPLLHLRIYGETGGIEQNRRNDVIGDLVGCNKSVCAGGGGRGCLQLHPVITEDLGLTTLSFFWPCPWSFATEDGNQPDLGTAALPLFLTRVTMVSLGLETV